MATQSDTMLTITLYLRKDDPNSDEARANLDSLKEQFPHRLVEVDVDSDPAMQKTLGEDVPVVDVGPYRLKSPFNKQKLMMTISAANDRRGQLDKLGREDHYERVRRGQEISRADRIMYWISKHYMAVLNTFMLLYFGLPVLAPVLMKVGATGPAEVIYTVYKPLCHQFAFRTFFLFGEQPYYPTQEAKMAGVITFAQATNITDTHNPLGYGRLQAREFIGNQTLGYKMAFCERDFGIYAAMFLFGILYVLSGRRLKPLHWILWVVIGMGPIGLDGFSQLFSQMDWPFLATILPYRESTPMLRLLTGAIFGFATAWFAYPYIEESMAENRQFFIKKFAAITQHKTQS